MSGCGRQALEQKAKEKAGDGNQGQVNRAVDEVRGNSHGDAPTGQEVNEAESGKGTGDEVGNGFPE